MASLNKTNFTFFLLLQAYRAVYGRYTDKVENLELPPYVLSSLCIKNVSIKMDWTGFVATVTSMDENVEEGHIRTDRMLWMGDNSGELYWFGLWYVW